MIAVTFADRVHELSIPQAQALWVDGTIDRVRMDGEDYFMASDVALVLANQGFIHEDAFVKKGGVAKGGGQCGRGWVGVKGSCKRMAKGADRAGAQKSALKEFALGQRMNKFGIKAQSPQQKAVIEQGREMFGSKAKSKKSGPSRESKINTLRTKLEDKVQKLNDREMAERMKNGKTKKYNKLSEASDKIAGYTENESMNPRIAAKQSVRSSERQKTFEKSVGMEGITEKYESEQDQKAKTAVQKSIDRKGYANYKKSKEGIRPDFSSASSLSRGRNGIKSKAQAEEASKNHPAKKRR